MARHSANEQLTPRGREFLGSSALQASYAHCGGDEAKRVDIGDNGRKRTVRSEVGMGFKLEKISLPESSAFPKFLEIFDEEKFVISGLKMEVMKVDVEFDGKKLDFSVEALTESKALFCVLAIFHFLPSE
jgi:hypothetical protein